MSIEYNIIFEDDELNKKVENILDEINEYVADDDVFVDVLDFAEDYIKIIVDFNMDTGEYEFDIQNEVCEMVKGMGYECEWDKYPNIDDCGCCYSYDGIIKLT